MCGLNAGKQVETSKLNALLVEGFGIPILSRAKQQVKVFMEKAVLTVIPSIAANETTGTGGGSLSQAIASAPSKRGPKPAAQFGQTHTLVSEALACSSDDEIKFVSMQRAAAAGIESKTNLQYIKYSTACSELAMAPAPKGLWPVKEMSAGPLGTQGPPKWSKSISASAVAAMVATASATTNKPQMDSNISYRPSLQIAELSSSSSSSSSSYQPNVSSGLPETVGITIGTTATDTDNDSQTHAQKRPRID